MKKKLNYLDKIPVHSPKIIHNADKSGVVTLQIDNKGIINKTAQILFGKPKTSFIHLDETGSFVWLMIDGHKSIYDIAVLLDEKSGKYSYPLYERISSFFSTLERNNFIFWIE